MLHWPLDEGLQAGTRAGRGGGSWGCGCGCSKGRGCLSSRTHRFLLAFPGTQCVGKATRRQPVRQVQPFGLRLEYLRGRLCWHMPLMAAASHAIVLGQKWFMRSASRLCTLRDCQRRRRSSGEQASRFKGSAQALCRHKDDAWLVFHTWRRRRRRRLIAAHLYEFTSAIPQQQQQLASAAVVVITLDMASTCRRSFVQGKHCAW